MFLTSHFIQGIDLDRCAVSKGDSKYMSIQEQRTKERAFAHCEDLNFHFLPIPDDGCVVYGCTTALCIGKIRVEAIEKRQSHRLDSSNRKDEEAIKARIDHKLDSQAPLTLKISVTSTHGCLP